MQYRGFASCLLLCFVLSAKTSTSIDEIMPAMKIVLDKALQAEEDSLPSYISIHKCNTTSHFCIDLIFEITHNEPTNGQFLESVLGNVAISDN